MTNSKPINLLYDISILGLGHYNSLCKTGVYRVIENIAHGLVDSKELNLSFYDSKSEVYLNASQKYLMSNPKLNNVPLVRSNFLLEPKGLEGIDIFHSGFYEIPYSLKQEKKIKLFLTVHDLIPLLLPKLFLGVNDGECHRIWSTLNTIDINDYVICVSNATRNDLLNNFKLEPAKVSVIHNAASSELFYLCNDCKKNTYVRQKYAIPESPYLLSLSTLEPRKNIDHVIRCFAKMVQEQGIKDLNLVLVGAKGWDYDKIFQEIERHALIQNRIIFTGYVDDEDLAPLYSGALAFVYMSFYEGFGIPPLEAMQCGVPVITSNTSSFPEVVGDAGIMLDPKDIDGLCHSLFEIYQKSSLRNKLSLSSLEQAKKFSWEKCVRETINAYKSALEEEKSSAIKSQLFLKEKDFLLPVISQKEQTILTNKFRIIIDGVFFQLYNTGIGRVWKSLLEEWVANGFAKNVLVLDREEFNMVGTVPRMPGIRYRLVPKYNYSNTNGDREMLQQVCDEEEADLFISTYYTTPLTTPSVFLAHDMIPELMGADLNHPMWREKHYGINHASAYIAVSENTARDLVKVFPEIALESITVAKNGVNHEIFSPASLENINRFKTKYGIAKPYFILVGGREGYKNTILFFKAFAQLCSKHGFEIVCTGSGRLLEAEFRKYTSGSVVHILQLSDEELSTAYSGAVALVYPSIYEGFGLPVLEAIASGCPVITCPNGAIPEVAGEAAIYVNYDDVDGLANALCEVQKPSVQSSLIAQGLKQAEKFSWTKMADIVSSALIDATLLPLNLRDINFIIFPDWSQPEELLCCELEQVIKAIATHPDSSQMVLLVYKGDIPEEEAALLLSGVSMNLLMQEDLNISEGLEISLVGQLSTVQWVALLPHLQARIVLENENQEASAFEQFNRIPSYQLNSLNHKQLSLPENKPVNICQPPAENRVEVFNNKSNVKDMIYLGDYKALTKTVFGHKIIVDTRDISLTPHILLDGSWEIWMARVLKEAIKEGMTIVEIGANIGYHTLFSASLVGEKGKVYAFEANPKVFETLYKNIAINGLDNRTVLVNKAVFKESKKLKFHTLKQAQGSSSIINFSDEFLKHYMDEVEIIEVDALSLDNFFADKTPKIDLIKIDAEGSEPYIFQGMKNIIRDNPQVTIICEFSPQLISGAEEDPRTFLEEVTNYGFKLMRINTDSKLVSVSVDDLLSTPHCDILLRR